MTKEGRADVGLRPNRTRPWWVFALLSVYPLFFSVDKSSAPKSSAPEKLRTRVNFSAPLLPFDMGNFDELVDCRGSRGHDPGDGALVLSKSVEIGMPPSPDFGGEQFR